LSEWLLASQEGLCSMELVGSFLDTRVVNATGSWTCEIAFV